MGDLEPITRNEKLWSGEDLTPVTRKEMYIKHLYDETQVIPEYPVTREEMFILKADEELHDVTIEQLTATENKTYSEGGVAYSPVIVNVPQTTLTTLDVTENGTYTAPSGTAYSEVDVNVPLPSNAYLLKELEDVEIASFNDGSDLPMPKLEVAIEPVQEGSGDPSPENIRPISGWDECKVSVSGVNVWDEEWEVGNINDGSGEDLPQDNVIRSKGYIRVMSGASYYIKCPTTGISRLFLYAKDKSFITYVPMDNIINNIYTVPNNCKYIRFRTLAAYGATYNHDISINHPSTDTSYHAYNGHTYTIDLDGTRYGGKVDLVSGVMTVTHGIKVYSGNSSEGWYADGTQSGSTYRMKASDVPSNIKLPPSNADAMSAISNQFIATSADNIFLGNEGIGVPINGGYLTIYDSVYNTNDVSLWKTHLASNPVQLVYELATPLTIQLTPTVVKSLKGKNNVYADSGAILDAEYIRDLTTIIDYILEQLNA